MSCLITPLFSNNSWTLEQLPDEVAASESRIRWLLKLAAGALVTGDDVVERAARHKLLKLINTNSTTANLMN